MCMYVCTSLAVHLPSLQTPLTPHMAFFNDPMALLCFLLECLQCKAPLFHYIFGTIDVRDVKHLSHIDGLYGEQ